MKQLLLIAYYFPPLGGAGVQRSAKLAKYLARMGWRLYVVAAEPAPFEPLDPSLEEDINHPAIQVVRVTNREPFRGWDRFPGGWRVRAFLQDWLLFPDRMSGWLKPALATAGAICKEHPGIPVLTTSAPYTAHLIGLRLKELYHSLWFADFRDEWTQNPYLKYPTGFHATLQRRAEAKVLTAADGVISVTETITTGLKQLLPRTPAAFATIPNGFDPEDLNDLTYHPKSSFVITHVGTLNGSRLELVKPLIELLKQLADQGRFRPGTLKLRLIGPGAYQSLNLAGYDFVEICAYLPHHDALAAMADSDLLILAEGNPAAFTGKIFEYLGLRRPVLGLVHPQSPAAALIRAANAGWVVDAGDRESLAKLMMDAYQFWQAGQAPLTFNLEVIDRYNRQRQAERFAEFITRGG